MLEHLVFLPFASLNDYESDENNRHERNLCLQNYRFFDVVFNPTCCVNILDITLLTWDLWIDPEWIILHAVTGLECCCFVYWKSFNPKIIPSKSWRLMASKENCKLNSFAIKISFLCWSKRWRRQFRKNQLPSISCCQWRKLLFAEKIVWKFSQDFMIFLITSGLNFERIKLFSSSSAAFLYLYGISIKFSCSNSITSQPQNYFMADNQCPAVLLTPNCNRKLMYHKAAESGFWSWSSSSIEFITLHHSLIFKQMLSLTFLFPIRYVNKNRKNLCG